MAKKRKPQLSDAPSFTGPQPFGGAKPKPQGTGQGFSTALPPKGPTITGGTGVSSGLSSQAPTGLKKNVPGGGTFETERLDPNASVGERFKHTAEVFKISLNPFSEDGVVAASGSKVFNSVAEFVAEHPYMTALAATGAVAAAKVITAKVGAAGLSAKAAQIGGGVSATQVATNSVTQKLTGNALVKSGFTLIAAAWIVKEALETFPFAKFEIAESMDKLGYSRSKAAEKGRWDLVDGLNELQSEILNPTGWENVISKIPWANIQRAAKRNIDAAVASTEVFNQIIEDERIKQETGETDDDRWARIKQQEADQDIAAIDYYNTERKKLIGWEQEARAAANASQRSEEKKARNEDAKFWAKEAAKQREFEAKDRKAIADFWTAYRKRMQQIADNNRPSNLNFGII